jgi:hypothetical protein
LCGYWTDLSTGKNHELGGWRKPGPASVARGTCRRVAPGRSRHRGRPRPGGRRAAAGPLAARRPARHGTEDTTDRSGRHRPRAARGRAGRDYREPPPPLFLGCCTPQNARPRARPDERPPPKREELQPGHGAPRPGRSPHQNGGNRPPRGRPGTGLKKRNAQGCANRIGRPGPGTQHRPATPGRLPPQGIPGRGLRPRRTTGDLGLRPPRDGRRSIRDGLARGRQVLGDLRPPPRVARASRA